MPPHDSLIKIKRCHHSLQRHDPKPPDKPPHPHSPRSRYHLLTHHRPAHTISKSRHTVRPARIKTETPASTGS
jgi:hypothetical protein